MLCLRLVAGLLAIAASGCCVQCNDNLRGSPARSADGGTTLAVLEAAPGCVLSVDGKPWTFPLGVAGAVKPGMHTVSCSNTGETIDVDAPAGFASTLDSWGP